MRTELNIKIIDALYNAFSTGDMPTVLGLMHPEIEWNEAESNSLADGNPYVGPDSILEGVFARLGANHEYFGLQDVKVHGMNDNMVLATLRYDAKVKMYLKCSALRTLKAHLNTFKKLHTLHILKSKGVCDPG